LIKELKEISSIPIVGNGDINTPEDAKEMIDETNCDYVMIGRGAMGNPFLFEQINDYLKTNSYHEYSFKDRLDSFFDYLHLTDKYKIKFANLKGQAMRFTKGMKGGSKIRSKITLTTNIEELEKIMTNAYLA
jgi:tRNA-dihydrouridine synthase